MLNKEEQLAKIQEILDTKKKAKNHGTNQKVSRKTERHVWSIEEENLAIDLYLDNACENTIKIEVEKTELKLSSMKMKLMNIKFLDTGEGLANVSELTKNLWEKRLDSNSKVS